MSSLDWFIVIVMAIPSVGFAIYFSLDIPTRKASMEWPSTEGIVLKAELTNRNDGEPPSASILYRYSVNNQEYVTNRYKVGSYSCFNGNSKESIEQHLEKYHEGAVIKVYYDPSNPSYGARKRGY